MNKTEIISDIKIELTKNPYDVLHDVSHHYETWKNCIEIIRSEKIRGIDQFSLEIAAWSHDLETYYQDNNEFRILKRILSKHNVGSKQVAKIIDTIIHHSFGTEQNTVESKILTDSDKLEHISIPRWIYTLDAYKEGLFKKERIIYYEKLQNKLLDQVYDRLHFSYSRKIYKKKLKDWYEYAESVGILTEDKKVIIRKRL